MSLRDTQITQMGQIAQILSNYPSDLVADVKKYGAYDCPLLSYYLFYYARKEKLSYLCGEKRPDKKLRS